MFLENSKTKHRNIKCSHKERILMKNYIFIEFFLSIECYFINE